ncbi:hypothetical protein N7454_002950 [Penicillium verhagenii]|nr:hypothetical protein N7454_002950 [Penicillium verhagenii]
MDENKIIEPDKDDFIVRDQSYPDDWQSETTSIGSSIYRGLMENGRRYQSLRNDDYLVLVFLTVLNSVPSDELQFETYEAGNLLAIIMDSDRENPLFRSPIGEEPQHILDIGTGEGSWAVDVADRFPNKVDDAMQPWTWREPFDLVHMRLMTASWSDSEWDVVYKQCYDNIKPGGWIEQLEGQPDIECGDGSLPADNIIRTWGPYTRECARKSGRELNAMLIMTDKIRKAGFVDIQEQEYKWPIGPWPRDKRLKEAGMVNYHHFMSGMEGWCMHLLTKFGSPEPWSKEEVIVYTSNLRRELKNPRYHTYLRAKRVWARKPFPDELEERIGIKDEPLTLI